MSLLRRASLIFLALCGGPSILAHGNARPRDYHELWSSWEFDPLVVFSLALSAWLYTRGLRRLWSATRVGSGIRKWHAASFALGWLAVFVALISPLHPWGRSLFAAHMTQHEVLMLVAAPLMVLGRPMVVFLWAFSAERARSFAALARRPEFEKLWKAVSGAFAAWLIHLVALWIWHIPALFEATIHNDFVHALQHFSFLGSALLFWWAVFHGPQRAMGYGLAVVSIFTTALHSGLLGALLTFTDRIWYPAYAETAGDWGLTALQDQQLGGLIMWIPAGVVYILAGLALFAGWLERANSKSDAALDALVEPRRTTGPARS